jgi:hypothetical protein
LWILQFSLLIACTAIEILLWELGMKGFFSNFQFQFFDG